MKSDTTSILKKGDEIGLITPAGFITSDMLETAVRNLRDMELEPLYFDSVTDKSGYLAGTDIDRLEELHKMYEDKKVKAVLCVRGGYGTTRLLDKINYRLIKKNPKPLIGYSDITALQSAIYMKTGIPGIHGIVGAKPFTDYTKKQFKNIFFNSNKEIKIRDLESNINNYTINKGTASGIIVGGNLSMLCSLSGTKFDLDLRNKIICIEETNEPPYKIDRMLTQLKSAGKFNDVKGIILGNFNKCDINNFDIEQDDSYSLAKVIEDIIKPLNIPSIYGFSFGHTEEQAIIPFGTKAVFNAETSEIIIKREVFKDFL